MNLHFAERGRTSQRWQRVKHLAPSIVVCLVILLAVTASSFMAPVQPHRISQLSLVMQREAERLFAAGEHDAAIGYFETALVADPRNVDALIGLGDAARQQNLPGKAIGHFRGALRLRPDDARALAGQGNAYAARGAIALARQNLAQLQNLCGEEACAEITELNAAIQAAGARASPRTALRPDQVMPRPMIEALPN